MHIAARIYELSRHKTPVTLSFVSDLSTAHLSSAALFKVGLLRKKLSCIYSITEISCILRKKCQKISASQFWNRAESSFASSFYTFLDFIFLSYKSITHVSYVALKNGFEGAFVNDAMLHGIGKSQYWYHRIICDRSFPMTYGLLTLYWSLCLVLSSRYIFRKITSQPTNSLVCLKDMP